MKVAPLITVALILCIAFLSPIQAKKKPKPKPNKFCIGKDGNRYEVGKGYDDNEGKVCVQYKCVKKKKKLVMKKGKCISLTVDGEWSNWSDWSACTSTCGDATKTRKRTCSNPPPSDDGSPCPGMKEEIEDCCLPSCGSVENVNVTALELNVQSLNDTMQFLNDSVQSLQTTMQAVLELLTTMQSTANKQGTCLSDLSSSDCPTSAAGKVGVVDGIAANTVGVSTNAAGLASSNAGIATNKAGISSNKDGITSNTDTCSSIQATATKLETCLGDVNSVNCPSSKDGKTSVSDAIMENKDALMTHHPAQTGGSTIQTTTLTVTTTASTIIPAELSCPSLNINTQNRRDVEVLKSIGSAEECSNKCREKTTCNFWTWAHKDAGKWALDCLLMSGYGHTASDNNVISGSRTCNPGECSTPPIINNGQWRCSGSTKLCTLKCNPGYASLYSTTTCIDGAWTELDKMECSPSVFLLLGGSTESIYTRMSTEADITTEIYHPQMENLTCSNLLPTLDRTWTDHATFLHNGLVYMCGGDNTKDLCTSLNLTHQTSQWKSYNISQVGRYGHSAVVMQNMVYFIGGENVESMLTTLPLANESLFSPVPNISSTDGYHCIVKVDEDCFIITGGSPSYVENTSYLYNDTTVIKYNISTQSLTVLPQQNSRFAHGCVMVEEGDKRWIVVAGGVGISSTQRLNLDGGAQWESLGDLHGNRDSFGMVETEKGIMAIGGYLFSWEMEFTRSFISLDTVELLNWSTQQWKVLESSLKTPRYRFGQPLEVPASVFGCYIPTGLLHTDANYEYYKVPVPASSKMTSAVVLTTCIKLGMKPQCYHRNYVDSNCVQAPSTSIQGEHPRGMSQILCSTTSPQDCASTLNMFWYMKNWASGSACGATKDGGFCSVGKEYTSTSDMQYFAACLKPVTTDWTIIQRRGQYGNAEDYFYKDFKDYENGFGSVDGELWIGLKKLAALTKDGEWEWELQVDLTDWDDKKYHAKYGMFSVGPAPTYTLHVGGFKDGESTLGDSMAYHDGQAFSARDKDQDASDAICAVLNKGAWWYKSCLYVNLNGLNFAQQKDYGGMKWYNGKDRGIGSKTWKASVMKIKRVKV